MRKAYDLKLNAISLVIKRGEEEIAEKRERMSKRWAKKADKSWDKSVFL